VHEKRLMDDLMREILRRVHAEGARRVTRVRVRLGALSHFTDDHFREHFEDAARGTIAEGARVEAELGVDPTDAAAQSVVLEELDVEY
jgi:hydrogenase nickel incorporation protein HypA/HybF